jgi:hypothetical protein
VVFIAARCSWNTAFSILAMGTDSTFNLVLGPTQPPIQSVSGFVPGVKLPAREVDHSVVEVKNEWSYTSTLPLYIHSVDRDKFAIF